MYDLIIRNGYIIDGSGNPGFHADLAVRDGRIAAIGSRLPEDAKAEIDAKGHVVAPGFVDSHSHDDIIVENMPEKDVAALKSQIEGIDHVDTVLWYDSVADLSMPMEMLPAKIYDAFNRENCTLMAVFFDSGMSEDGTLDAIRAIRKTANKQCFISGMSAMVIDLKDLCEAEEPIDLSEPTAAQAEEPLTGESEAVTEQTWSFSLKS